MKRFKQRFKAKFGRSAVQANEFICLPGVYQNSVAMGAAAIGHYKTMFSAYTLLHTLVDGYVARGSAISSLKYKMGFNFFCADAAVHVKAWLVKTTNAAGALDADYTPSTANSEAQSVQTLLGAATTVLDFRPLGECFTKLNGTGLGYSSVLKIKSINGHLMRWLANYQTNKDTGATPYDIRIILDVRTGVVNKTVSVFSWSESSWNTTAAKSNF